MENGSSINRVEVYSDDFAPGRRCILEWFDANGDHRRTSMSLLHLPRCLDWLFTKGVLPYDFDSE